MSDAAPVETASAEIVGQPARSAAPANEIVGQPARSAAPADEPEQPTFKRQREWPLLGPVLWIFGAVLWAYIVAGELAVRTDATLVEALGAVAVLATLGANWYAAAECNRHRKEWELRILPGLIAVGLWVVLLGILTRISGAPTRSEVETVTLTLWIVSLVAFLSGRYLTGASRRHLTSRGRFGRIALWTISALVTLIALGSATSQF